MSISTRPLRNQIGFHEKINVISNASGPILLDITKSTTHLINVTNNCIIAFKEIPSKYQVTNNSYIEHFIILNPGTVGNNKTVTLDPRIVWDYYNNTANNIFTLVTNQYIYLHLFSLDCGNNWFGSVIGKYTYTTNQAIIITPNILTNNSNNILSFTGLRLFSSPLESTIINATHQYSNWKITSDQDGDDIIISDLNSSDLTCHVFDNSKTSLLQEDVYYYAFVQYKASELSDLSLWSNPIKFKLLNINVDNPNQYLSTDFIHIKDSQTNISISTNKYDSTKIVNSNINFEQDQENNIILLFDETSSLQDSVTVLANDYIEFNKISGLLTDISITFNTSVGSDIQLIADDSIILDGILNNNTITFNPDLNLLIQNKLKIIFKSNCVISHIGFTMI